MQDTIRLGTRPSALAFKQACEIAGRFPQLKFKIVPIETEGDRDKNTPLTGTESGDFFTYDIEKALLEDKIDAAVHSAKDLEEEIPYGLRIIALTRAVSPDECLVSRGNLKLAGLPRNAIIGTSSRKRKEAVKKFRNDLIVKDIRGTIDERLEQLDKGYYDAVITAHAALIRLGYEDKIAQIIASHIIEPHPLQGRLAVEIKSGRKDLAEVFGSINED